MAHDCARKRLLVTHVMPELEDVLHDALALVRGAYEGELIVPGPEANRCLSHLG
ncbi:MAG: hypothetical protein M3Y17_12385 [Actinomycetota bacterium]|nr:hypothetical protein [Actinomycetota bacterium]